MRALCSLSRNATLSREEPSPSSSTRLYMKRGQNSTSAVTSHCVLLSNVFIVEEGYCQLHHSASINPPSVNFFLHVYCILLQNALLDGRGWKCSVWSLVLFDVSIFVKIITWLGNGGITKTRKYDEQIRLYLANPKGHYYTFRNEAKQRHFFQTLSYNSKALRSVFRLLIELIALLHFRSCHF